MERDDVAMLLEEFQDKFVLQRSIKTCCFAENSTDALMKLSKASDLCCPVFIVTLPGTSLGPGFDLILAPLEDAALTLDGVPVETYPCPAPCMFNYTNVNCWARGRFLVAMLPLIARHGVVLAVRKAVNHCRARHGRTMLMFP